jgi:predicted DNA-binding transcriptional regulator AlpA
MPRPSKTMLPLNLERQTLSLTEAALMVGISRATMYGLVNEGRGPRITIVNRARRVRVEEIGRWLKELEKKTEQARQAEVA